jgi:hypothetical protein
MKRKILYSDIEQPVDYSLAILVAKIMGFLGIIVTVIVLLFGG